MQTKLVLRHLKKFWESKMQQPSTSSSGAFLSDSSYLSASPQIFTTDNIRYNSPNVDSNLPYFLNLYYFSTITKKNAKDNFNHPLKILPPKNMQLPDYDLPFEPSVEDVSSSPYSMQNKPILWTQFLWRNKSLTEHCIPIQTQIPEKVDLLHFQLLFTVLYFVVWFSAIFGNLSVLYLVTLKQVKLSSVRSVFICNLAISDIVLSLTSLPITAVSIFTRDWVFPKLFCNLIGVFQGGSIFVSSFTLTAIAVDCYILVRHPASEKINITNAVLIVIFIWIIGYVFALPVGIFSATADYHPFCGLFCEEFWPDSNELGVSQMRKFYGISVLIIQFGLPVAISSLCYWTIGKIIGEQLVKRKQQQIIFQANQTRLESRKSRSNRMMITMVFGLVLAWLPMNLINLYRDFDTAEHNSSWYSLIFAACHVTAMTSAVWNPIIYSWFNPQMKETLKKALERHRRRTSEGTYVPPFSREHSSLVLKDKKSEIGDYPSS